MADLDTKFSTSAEGARLGVSIDVSLREAILGESGDGTMVLAGDGTFKVGGGGSGITQLTGDVTAGPGTGPQAATVVKINGSSPAASATTDTTNAANISSGTLPAARLPAPGASTLGGVKSASAGSHQFQTGIDTSGNPTFAQPAAADVSGLAASATTDTTNATNISSGTLGAARLPAPGASTLGGVKSSAAGSHQFATGINTSGVVTYGQPAASDVSGLAASATTDTTNASNISSGTLDAARLPVAPVRSVSGTTDTLAAADNGGIVRYTSSSAVTVTIPHATVAAGFACLLLQMGTGKVTTQGDGTSTVVNRQSQLSIAGQNGAISVTSDATDHFVIAGDTAA